jgi:hypothetical protein
MLLKHTISARRPQNMQTLHNMPPEQSSVARDVPKTRTTNFFMAKRHARYCGLVCGPQMRTTSGIHNCLNFICNFYSIHMSSKAAFNKKKHPFHRQSVNLRKKLVRCYIWSISFVWCWNWDIADITWGILGKFWNVVPEKDGDQMDRSREKYYMESIRRGITYKL